MWCTWQVHKPRQVIIVALLTSIFWFALNTVILVSYQVNIASNELKVAHSVRHENKNNQLGFEWQSEDKNEENKLLPHGISEVGLHGAEKLDTINNEIRSQHKPNHDTLQARQEFIQNHKLNRNTRLETRKKKPKLLKKKLISAVRSIPPEDIRKDTADTNIGGIKKTRDPNGPGEYGKAVVIPAEEKKNEKDGYSKYAFNEYASTKISLERSIQDTRTSG